MSRQARKLSVAAHRVRAAIDLIAQARRMEPRGLRDVRMLGLIQALAQLDARIVAMRRDVDARPATRERRAAKAA